MKRTILFRGFRKWECDWIEGYLLDDEYIGRGNDSHPVYPETVGQYTGKDHKSGTKLFEGDILQYTNKDGSTARYVITWDDAMSAWVAKWTAGAGSFPVGVAAQIMEIIGNIHDNPELVEV